MTIKTNNKKGVISERGNLYNTEFVYPASEPRFLILYEIDF